MSPHTLRNRIFSSVVQIGAINLAAFTLPQCREAPPKPSPTSAVNPTPGAAASAPWQSQSYQFHTFDIGTYETTASKTLEEVIDQVCRGELEGGQVLLMDVLLRIGQETAAAGLEDIFSAAQADVARAELLAIAQEAAAALSDKAGKRGASALSPQETIRELNQVIYAGQTRFGPRESSLQDVPAEVRTASIYATWQSKKGICEDLVGIYASVIDLLRRGGIDLPIQTIILPGHVMLRWAAPQSDDSLCIEATKWGETKKELYTAWSHGLKLESLGGELPGSGLAGVIQCELRNSFCSALEQDPALAERLAHCASRLDKTSPFAVLSAAKSWLGLAGQHPEKSAFYAQRAYELLETGSQIWPNCVSLMQSKALALKIAAINNDNQISSIELSLGLMRSSLSLAKSGGAGDELFPVNSTHAIIACWLSQIAWLSASEERYLQARSYILEDFLKDQWVGDKFEILGDLNFGFFRANGNRAYLEEALQDFNSQIRYGDEDSQVTGQLKLAVALLYGGDTERACRIFDGLAATSEPEADLVLAENIRLGQEICAWIGNLRLIDTGVVQYGMPLWPLAIHNTDFAPKESRTHSLSQGIIPRDPRVDLIDFIELHQQSSQAISKGDAEKPASGAAPVHGL